jgi:hypothetical protein
MGLFHNRSVVIPPFSIFIPLSRDERDCRRSVKTRPTTPNVAFQRTSSLFHILEVSVQASAKRLGTRTDDFCQFPRSFRQMAVFTSHQARATYSSRAIRYLSVTLPCDTVFTKWHYILWATDCVFQYIINRVNKTERDRRWNVTCWLVVSLLLYIKITKFIYMRNIGHYFKCQELLFTSCRGGPDWLEWGWTELAAIEKEGMNLWVP